MNTYARPHRSPVSPARTSSGKGSPQTRLVLLTAFGVGLFVVVGLLHVSSRVALVRAGYELSRVERENRELIHEQERITLERATLRNTQRIDTLAKARLGMAPPAATQIISIAESPPSRPAALSMLEAHP